MPFTEEEIKDLSERLWNKRVIYSSKGDPVMFRMHFDSAISIAFEMANQRIAQLESYISDNLHKKAICVCGDSIEPDTGAVCGTCASIEQASQPQVPEGWQLVPKEPNAEMAFAGAAEMKGLDQNGRNTFESGDCGRAALTYMVMLERAPKHN